MASSPQELIYEEAHRAVAMQAQSLDELRSRTGVLLAVAAVSSTVLARTALQDGSLNSTESVGGICLAGVGVLAILILFPWAPRRKTKLRKDRVMDDPELKGWFFVLDADDLAKEFGDKTPADLPDVYRKVAEDLWDDYNANEEPLSRRYFGFEAAAVLLVFGVGLWLFDVASG